MELTTGVVIKISGLTQLAQCDRFTFSNPAEGLDIITDFASTPDTIAVSAAGFGGGLTLSTLSSLKFFVGASATTATQINWRLQSVQM
ncbi:hypothetical protein [Nostoc sp. C117]|uniref:hypothetical protein n=1 Tax=Nostoc sp. C117 TaxID=3349875 RepID=UPI00370D91B8